MVSQRKPSAFIIGSVSGRKTGVSIKNKNRNKNIGKRLQGPWKLSWKNPSDKLGLFLLYSFSIFLRRWLPRVKTSPTRSRGPPARTLSCPVIRPQAALPGHKLLGAKQKGAVGTGEPTEAPLIRADTTQVPCYLPGLNTANIQKFYY